MKMLRLLLLLLLGASLAAACGNYGGRRGGRGVRKCRCNGRKCKCRGYWYDALASYPQDDDGGMGVGGGGMLGEISKSVSNFQYFSI